MPGFGDIVQKAFYMGVGLASYATEKAGVTLQELKTQAQKVADQMVERGEMTAEEARKYVDELLKIAQQQQTVEESKDNNTQETQTREPRRIEILSEDEDSSKKDPENVDLLREQVKSLQEELRRLKRE
jgi:polyhydroxyalkanoate synthesis regulator phasin